MKISVELRPSEVVAAALKRHVVITQQNAQQLLEGMEGRAVQRILEETKHKLLNHVVDYICHANSK